MNCLTWELEAFTTTRTQNEKNTLNNLPGRQMWDCQKTMMLVMKMSRRKDDTPCKRKKQTHPTPEGEVNGLGPRDRPAYMFQGHPLELVGCKSKHMVVGILEIVLILDCFNVHNVCCMNPID